MTVRGMSLLDAFLMLSLITFWGSSFVVVKILLKEGLTPIATATFRFIIAGGLFLAALLLARSRKRNYRLLVKTRDVPVLLLLALTGVTFFFSLQYTGIQMAGASIAAIFVCLLSPILISILSALVFKEHLIRKQVFGIGIAALGTFIIITANTSNLTSSEDPLVGSLILLITPFLWATYSLLGRKLMEKYDAFLVVAYVNMFGGLCLIPFSYAEDSLRQIVAMSLRGWVAILFLAVTCSLLGYYIWFYVLRKAGPAKTSTFLFVEPLVTVLFEFMLTGEAVSWFIVAGSFLILIGIYLVNKKQA